jgi:hypothetical protein
MRDLGFALAHRPGALAAMGEALGAAGVSIEGGGAFLVAGTGHAHFLVAEPDAARAVEALRGAGIAPVSVREVVVLKLDQGRPGQLGLAARRMAEAGVQIEVQYSDHANRLILVVDDPVRGGAVAEAWMRGER